MKSRKMRRESPLSSSLGGFLICALSLFGCCFVAAAVLLLFERPIAAIPAAALAVSILSGALSGLFTRQRKSGWVGAVALVALWILLGVIFTKGHFPATALVGAATFLVCHLLCKLMPEKKRKKKSFR